MFGFAILFISSRLQYVVQIVVSDDVVSVCCLSHWMVSHALLISLTLKASAILKCIAGTAITVEGHSYRYFTFPKRFSIHNFLSHIFIHNTIPCHRVRDHSPLLDAFVHVFQYKNHVLVIIFRVLFVLIQLVKAPVGSVMCFVITHS